jgi:hypothetical protein
MADLSDLVYPLQDVEMQIYNSISGCRTEDFRMQE